MLNFDSKIQQIEEALSFNKTFQAPDQQEIFKRALENIEDSKKKLLPDGTWHLDSHLFLDDKGITSLEGLNVSIVEGIFNVDNNKLTSLKGGPKEVGWTFNCSYNNLESLDGCPEKVGQNFRCINNKRKFTKDEVIERCEMERGNYAIFV